MTRKERLLERLKECCLDWDGDFYFEISEEEEAEEMSWFHVVVTSRFLFPACSFQAKVEVRQREDTIEMEWGEDSWHELDQENLFTFMFFDLAQRCTPEGFYRGEHIDGVQPYRGRFTKSE